MNEPHAKRILVVDDEKCIAETLALILRSSGYEAAPLNDGQSALQECARSIPDLVISDVMMPLLNGIELAIQIKDLYPRCRIILISGLGGSFDLAEQASKKGYNFELLSKPIHPVELLSRIRTVLTEDYPQATDQHVSIEACSLVSPGGRQSEVGTGSTQA